MTNPPSLDEAVGKGVKRTWIWMIVCAVVLVLAAYLLAVESSPVYASAARWSRAALAMVLIFALPGYAIISMFPHRELSFPERLTIGLGVDLAIVALVGVMLNWLPGGIQPAGWIAGLCTVTAVCLAYGNRRRVGHGVWATIPRPVARGYLRSTVLFTAAIVMVVGAMVIARHGALQQPVLGFTELWMLPPSQSVERQVHIGIRSYEGVTETYRLEIHRGTDVIMDREIRLESGETWETEFVLPMLGDGEQRVEARLYRAGDTETVYRRVGFWLDENTFEEPTVDGSGSADLLSEASGGIDEVPA